MAPHQETAQLLPGHHHHHRRRQWPNNRPVLLLFLGGFTVFTLCLFAANLPAVQQLTGVVPPHGVSIHQSPVTSAPHHEAASTTKDHSGPSEVDVLFQLIEQARAEKLENVTMVYGANKRPTFKDDPPLLVADLPQKHIPAYTPPSPTDGPEGGNQTHGRRLVIVGDVHGQLAALKGLLRKINFDTHHGDHLVLVGDMITKGPDSKGVVKLAMKLGASAVRGNQEDKVLAAAREIHRLSADDAARLGPAGDDIEDDDEERDGDDDLFEPEMRRKDHAHRIARSLTRAQLAWLRSLPIILRIGALPDATTPPWNATTLAVVHGGLVPGVELEKQDPWAVMNMRSLVYPRHGGRKKGKKHHSQSEAEDSNSNDENTNDVAPDAVAVPIDGRKGEPWSHAWNRHQNNLPPTHPRTLAIYGHDAKAGLQINPDVDISPYSLSSTSSPSSETPPHKPATPRNPRKKQPSPPTENNNNKKNKKKPPTTGLRYAFGLDSGCGHGKQLTALVMEATADGTSQRVEQVDCFGAYEPGRGGGRDGREGVQWVVDGGSESD